MKEKITEESIRLFEKKGFSDTSIQEIVDALGVTKGTFYYYFSNKEELLMDIHLGYINSLLHHQEMILNDPAKNCREKLFEIVYMLIHNIEHQGPSARVFFREMRHLSKENLEKITKKRDVIRFNIEKLLREGVQKGEFRQNLKVDIATFGILGVANWSYQWFNPKGPVTDREVAEIFVEMILSGIEA